MSNSLTHPTYPQSRAQKSPLRIHTEVRSLRTSSSLEIPSRPKELLADRYEKPLPEIPKAPINDARNYAADVFKKIQSPDPDLFPHKLEVKKKRQPMNITRRIEELTQQNGYLLAELAALKESRATLKELQHKTQEACRILEAALSVASHRARFSEQLLMEYWGTHLGDGSEEVRVF